MAKLIYTDGTIEEVKPKGAYFSLKELQTLVDCDIVQMIPIGGGRTAWMDEEGKLKAHEENTTATEFFGHRLLPGDYFAGRILICEANEVD
jgi:hypothetical protein